MDNENFIGTLIDSNERIISALELYDHVTNCHSKIHRLTYTNRSRSSQLLKSADQDSDEEVVEGMQKMQVTGGSAGEPELLKLQDKQRAAIARAAREQQRQASVSYDTNQYGFQSTGSDSQALHADLQDLTFGTSTNGQTYVARVNVMNPAYPC